MEIQKTVEPPIPVDPVVTFTITLTEQEAKDLYVLSGSIGGFPYKGDNIRATTDPLWTKLDGHFNWDETIEQKRYKNMPTLNLNEQEK